VSDILDRSAPPPTLTVQYGPRPEHVIDLWLPPDQQARGPVPGIVLVHGGFWRPAFDRTHLRPMAQALAAAGNVVAVPEYRRAGMAEEGWTGPFDDIAAALDAAGPLAEPHGADLGHLTWAGHSAGGHLALWAAARPGLPASSPWRGPCPATHVVSLAGCNSLRMCAEWNLGAGAVRNLMGGGPDEVPERYAVADPAALPPPPVPVTLVHGIDDDTVPIAVSRRYRAGRLVAIPGAGHFDLIDPLSPAWPQVLAALTGIHLPSLKRAVSPCVLAPQGDTAWRKWPGPGLDPSFPWPPGT
jgi:acetyl esterase/lipase